MRKPSFALTPAVVRIAASALLVAGSWGVVLPSPAQALPSGPITCRVYTYYSNAKKIEEVGTFARCPGGIHKGRTTRWFTVETFKIGVPGQNGPGGGPGDLPCEFLQAGCSNLPTPHH